MGVVDKNKMEVFYLSRMQACACACMVCARTCMVDVW